MALMFKDLCELYNKLETFSEKTTKTYLIANFLRNVINTEKEIIKDTINLIMGDPSTDKELGLGEKLVMRAIARAYGTSVEKVEEIFKKTGDLGKTAEILCKTGNKVSSFFHEPLTINRVVNTIKKISNVEGEGAIDKKINLFSSLLVDAEPIEARYLVRLVLGLMRLGIAEGILRDAIADALRVNVDIVERAFALTNDLGKVLEIGAKEGVEALKKLKPTPGVPIRMMLAHLAPSIEEVLFEFKGKLQAEFKYDGFRVQIHKFNNKVIIYSRNLENITDAFPEIVKEIKSFNGTFIIEGEIVAVESLETEKPLPFQYISRRIKRKYDIHKMITEIPAKLYLFDILYLNETSFIDTSLKERRKILEEYFEKTTHITFSEKIISDSIEDIESFYQKALDLGHEGLMLKNLESTYIPGKRVGTWYKLKPGIEPIDAVIIEAEWGEGKRARLLSSFLVAIKDTATDKLLPIGKVGSGLTDQQLEELTNTLKNLIIKEERKRVILKPEVVVEVLYQEIQKSPKYESGFALRFPRINRIRYDKGVNDIDTLERIKQLYELQFKRKES